jgi:hypothetical protein
MPRATVDIEETLRLELKSLPGGWVVLRRLTFGQIMQRRTMAASMRITGNGQKKQSFEGEMVMASQKVAEYEFKNCIVDHNLEDETGAKLNLALQRDIQRLDPRVGAEIDEAISKLNNFDLEDEEEGEAGN